MLYILTEEDEFVEDVTSDDPSFNWIAFPLHSCQLSLSQPSL